MRARSSLPSANTRRHAEADRLTGGPGRAPAQPWRPKTPEERGRELERISREYTRDRLRRAIATLGLCFLSTLVGVAGMSWAVSTTDDVLAPVVFWGALLAGYAGNAFALLAAYADSVRRDG